MTACARLLARRRAARLHLGRLPAAPAPAAARRRAPGRRRGADRAAVPVRHRRRLQRGRRASRASSTARCPALPGAAARGHRGLRRVHRRTDALVSRHPDPRVRLRPPGAAGRQVGRAEPRRRRGARRRARVHRRQRAVRSRRAGAAGRALRRPATSGMVSGQGLYAVASATRRARGRQRLRPLRGAHPRRRERARLPGQRRRRHLRAAPRASTASCAPTRSTTSSIRSRPRSAGFAVALRSPSAYTVEPPSSGGAPGVPPPRAHRRPGHAPAAALAARAAARARRWRAVWMLLSHRAPALDDRARAGHAPDRQRGAARARAACYTVTLGRAGRLLRAGPGRLARRARRARPRPRSPLPYYFCVVAAAGWRGLARFLRGGAQAVWAPAGAARWRERAA